MYEMNVLSYLAYVLAGVAIFPATYLMCKILRLDEQDTRCMLFVSVPSSLFCLILGVWGLIYVY